MNDLNSKFVVVENWITWAVKQEGGTSAPFRALADNLVAFLKHPGIYPRLLSAPASTAKRKHHAWEGGLLDHISEICDIMTSAYCAPVASTAPRKELENMVTEWPVIPMMDMVAVAVLHDIHKIGDAVGNVFYVPNMLKSKGGKPPERSEAIPYAINPVCNQYGLVVSAQSGEQRAVRSLMLRTYELMPGGELSLALVSAVSPTLYSLLPDSVKFAVRHHEGLYDPVLRRELMGNETPLQITLHYADMLSSRRGQWATPNTDVV